LYLTSEVLKKGKKKEKKKQKTPDAEKNNTLNDF